MPAPTAAEPAATVPSWLGRTYAALLGVALAVFVGAATVLALALPYHEWDAFAFGGVSRAIEQGTFALTDWGAAFLHRPLFYVLQGWVWSVLGFSFASGRLLSLLFALLLVGAGARLARDPAARWLGLSGVLGGLLLLAVPSLSIYAVAGLSDVPAAAMVALTAAVALTVPASRVRTVVLVTLAALTVLTKPSVLPPLAGLLVAVLLVDDGRDGIRLRDGWRGRARAALVPLAAGAVIGLAVDVLVAHRIGTGLGDFLTAGTGGYWADRAAAARWDALLRVDVLGTALRLPLAFTLLYVPARLARLAHRPAATGALVAAVLWTTAASGAAAEGSAPLWTAEAAFCWIGFLGLLAVLVTAPTALVPPRARLAQLALLGLPPLVVWWWGGAYDDRLAAPAWPGLCALLALALAAPVVQLARSAGVAALAPAVVLLVACWASLVSLDGFGGGQWRELRSLGWAGLRDDQRTLNLVLPAVQKSLTAVTPVLGSDGRLATTDPRFDWWFPGRVSHDLVVRCDQLRGYAAFVLVVSDETAAQLADAGGSDDPAWWARCSGPRLRQLTDGENGLAAFAVLR